MKKLNLEQVQATIKEMNEVMFFDPPIETDDDVDVLIKEIKDNVGEIIWDKDKFSDESLKVFAFLGYAPPEKKTKTKAATTKKAKSPGKAKSSTKKVVKKAKSGNKKTTNPGEVNNKPGEVNNKPGEVNNKPGEKDVPGNKTKTALFLAELENSPKTMKEIKEADWNNGGTFYNYFNKLVADGKAKKEDGKMVLINEKN